MIRIVSIPDLTFLLEIVKALDIRQLIVFVNKGTKEIAKMAPSRLAYP